jgi:hypothetical protein
MRSVLVLALLLACSVEARAQSGQGNAQPGRPDFLFGRPDGSIAFRGGWILQRAGSDLYDFVERELTVDRSDFNRAAFATDVAITLTSRADAVVGLEVSNASIGSEYRNLVDNNRQPIEQTTSLQEVNLSGGIRFALAPRGREVSRLAWVPQPVVPYVGAGAGLLWYRFRQVGDFVDALDPRMSVFPDRFEASGWTPSAHVVGGVDVKLTRRLYVTFDGRYLWAAGELSRDFEGFDPIDLAGFRFGAGVNVLF